MRSWLMTGLLSASLFGCAAPQHQMRRATSQRGGAAVASGSAKPAELGGDAVKVVAHRPSVKQYRFVGRVEARATTVDLVEAAIAADADLRRQAKALGANVVKLDLIAPPRDDARPRRRIILAGRAYRAIN